MSSCPVLALPDFTQSFVLECDASEIGIGAVLMQSGHPIAFESRKLREYERHYSIYDKEMLAIMHALTKFRQYLVGNRFKVKTDHNSLKFLMEQKELREWQRLTLGVNLTQQRIRRKSISKRLGHTHYSFWFWISICYCSWAFSLGVLLYKPLWATQWWNIHSPCSTAWSRGWKTPPHHSSLRASLSREVRSSLSWGPRAIPTVGFCLQGHDHQFEGFSGGLSSFYICLQIGTSRSHRGHPMIQ